MKYLKTSNLYAAREQSGKTQSQVAKEIGITESSYQRYEYGKVTPNAIIANRIARAVNSTVEKLWGYESANNSAV